MLWKGATSVYTIAEIKRPFLDSIEISASEEPDALEKAPLQFMPLRKLSRKCHFFVWFCTSNGSETYISLLIRNERFEVRECA